MKVRFIGSGEPGEDEVCTVFGLDFPRGEWVEVENEKLRNNPAFETDVDEDGEPGPSVEELRAALDAKGIAYHPRAGAVKLAEALAAASAEPQE